MNTTTIHVFMLIAAVILFGIALGLRLYVKRKRFYRRIYGHQQFDSYRASVIIPIGENLLLFIATLFTITALLLVLIVVT